MTKQKKKGHKGREKSGSTISNKALLLAMKANRVPSEVMSHRSKYEQEVVKTTANSQNYINALRGSTQAKKTDTKSKIPYKGGNRTYFRMFTDKQQVAVPSRG